MIKKFCGSDVLMTCKCPVCAFKYDACYTDTSYTTVPPHIGFDTVSGNQCDCVGGGAHPVNLSATSTIADDLRGYSFSEAFKMMEGGQPMRQRNSKEVIVKKLEYGGKWMVKEVGRDCFESCNTAAPIFSINDIVSEWVKHHEHA